MRGFWNFIHRQKYWFYWAIWTLNPFFFAIFMRSSTVGLTHFSDLENLARWTKILCKTVGQFDKISQFCRFKKWGYFIDVKISGNLQNYYIILKATQLEELKRFLKKQCVFMCYPMYFLTHVLPGVKILANQLFLKF